MGTGKDQTEKQSPNWYEEFDLPARFPRPPLDRIKELFNEVQEREPAIFLRQGSKHTDIVIRLAVGPGIFRPESRNESKRSAEFGLTLPQAFENVLWQKVRKKNATWTELVRLVKGAYCQAWSDWFKFRYIGHSHPAAKLGLTRTWEEIATAATKAHRGRRRATEAESKSLQKRFHQLLPKCLAIHRSAERAVASSHAKRNAEAARREIRRAIWESVRPSVHGMRGDGYIFAGEAFQRIPYAQGNAKLDDPVTWNPRQLAIALLSFERLLKYQTVEKKLAPSKLR